MWLTAALETYTDAIVVVWKYIMWKIYLTHTYGFRPPIVSEKGVMMPKKEHRAKARLCIYTHRIYRIGLTYTLSGHSDVYIFKNSTAAKYVNTMYVYTHPCTNTQYI